MRLNAYIVARRDSALNRCTSVDVMIAADAWQMEAVRGYSLTQLQDR
ncbi:MAG: hypothetical protein HXY36_06925 [Chloroflexi bacterium]|nr:hypothetical protein [Chloroflexota bacterium]